MDRQAASLFLSMSAADKEEERAKRLQKAASAECTPFSVSSGEGVGVFGGKSGSYTASLTACSCVDFSRRGGRYPCKHIYRLAHELGVMPLSGVVSDAAAIPARAPTTQERARAYDRCVSLISGYPEATRRELWQVLADRYKKEPHICESISCLLRPISDGLLQYADRSLVLQRRSKKWVVESLLARGFRFPPAAGKTQRDRHAWCILNAEEICALLCPEAYAVIPAGDLETANKKLYTYLRQEFYEEPVFVFYTAPQPEQAPRAEEPAAPIPEDPAALTPEERGYYTPEEFAALLES